MTGGGFGGCVIALVDQQAVDAVGDLLQKAYRTHGDARPDFFVASPQHGAQRLR